MKQFSKVVATIVKITNRGSCTFGHKKSEKFIFTEMGCDRPMCIYALQALMPAVEVLLHGGQFPWKKRKGALYWGCSHPGNLYKGRGQVIFKLELKK
jgi:uncharacterized repeat protein (TIGR04076 family)